MPDSWSEPDGAVGSTSRGANRARARGNSDSCYKGLCNNTLRTRHRSSIPSASVWHGLCVNPQPSNATQVNANLAAGKASLNASVVRSPPSLECPWFRGLPAEVSADSPAVVPWCFRYRPLQPGCLNSGKGEVLVFRLPGRNELATSVPAGSTSRGANAYALPDRSPFAPVNRTHPLCG